MSKLILSIDQMQELKRLGLNINKSSCYIWNSEGKDYLYFGQPDDCNCIRVFLAQDILDILPKSIDTPLGEYILEIDSYFDNLWRASYVAYVKNGIKELISGEGEELIDALFNLLYLCHKNRYISKDKYLIKND